MEHRALGKGLSALIPDKVNMASLTEGGATISYIKTAHIRPNPLQPRLNYDPAKLEELKASIKEKGILQPILVREAGEGFEIVAGERRYRAAQALNLENVPAVIKKISDEEACLIALIENIQREDLNAIEQAKAFMRLMDEFNFSQEQVAQSVGKDRSTVSNLMRLLKLPELIQNSVIMGELTMGHARALLSIENAAEQQTVFEKVLSKGISVRELENLIKTGLSVAPARRKIRGRQHDQELAAIEEDLQKTLGTKVRIQSQRKRGKILIEYYSYDDLERILQIIKR